MIGNLVGPYRVLDTLGAGGMGEVYRARDTRLQRDVAIKVLPAAFATDPDRRPRFEREAQVLAALNHPHIAAIYGVEETQGALALVLELVEGPTLADRLARGAIPLDEALPMARQIAEALEAAHEAGIVHRDLKPANIKLRPDGTVKVLDFGLAKAVDAASTRPAADGSSSPTLTALATGAGMILGTAAYMSPEQARGRAVDKRADIWAFGVVLWEMLTGRRLFDGETIGDTLAAVLTQTPELADLPATTPGAVRQTLARCLVRDPRQRLRDIGEARIALSRAEVPPPPPAPPRRFSVTQVALSSVTAALALAGVAWAVWPDALPAVAPTTRAVIAVQPDGAIIRSPAVSPDGLAVAFESRGRLWLQRLDEWDARALPGTEGGGSPFWSPDGRTIGFFTDRELMRVPQAGGEARAICALAVRVGRAGAPHRSGGVWRPDGTIVFTTEPGPAMEETTTDVFTTEFGPLYTVSAQGGDPRAAIQPPNGVLDFHDPAALPGRAELVVSLHRPSGRDALAVLAPDGSLRVLIERRGIELRRPVYSPTGHLVFHQIAGDATLQMNRAPGVWAVPFSLPRLEVTGEPTLVDAGGWPSVADDGTLIAIAPQAAVARQLGWFDRQGRLTDAVAPVREWREALAISPAGTRILGADPDGVWVSALDGSSRSRLTRGPRDSMAAWIGDNAIAFTREVDGVLSVVTKTVDSSAAERVVASRARYPSASRDGRYLMFNVLGDRPGSWEPAWIDLAADGTVHRLGKAHIGGRFPTISPDGRLVLYMSAETGRDEVFVTRFPSGRDKWQVSTDGGGWAGWGSGGTEILYRRGGRQSTLMSVAVTGDPEPRFGAPRALFAWNEHWAPYFAWTHDGTRGLTAVPAGPVRHVESLRVIRQWAPRPAGPSEATTP